jgi:hypothetical protein
MFWLALLFMAMLLNTKGRRLVFFCFICSKLENTHRSSRIHKDQIKFIFLKVQLLVTMFLLALLIVASIIKLKGQRLICSCLLFLQSWMKHTDLVEYLKNSLIHFLKVQLLVIMFLLALLIVAWIIKTEGQRLVSSCFLFLQSWKIHTDLTTL